MDPVPVWIQIKPCRAGAQGVGKEAKTEGKKATPAEAHPGQRSGCPGSRQEGLCPYHPDELCSQDER